MFLHFSTSLSLYRLHLFSISSIVFIAKTMIYSNEYSRYHFLFLTFLKRSYYFFLFCHWDNSFDLSLHLQINSSIIFLISHRWKKDDTIFSQFLFKYLFFENRYWTSSSSICFSLYNSSFFHVKIYTLMESYMSSLLWQNTKKENEEFSFLKNSNQR